MKNLILLKYHKPSRIVSIFKINFFYINFEVLWNISSAENLSSEEAHLKNIISHD